MIERFHHTLKAGLKCYLQNLIDVLPMVLMGFCSTVKENFGTLSVNMVFGTTLRLPGKFFITSSVQADHISFMYSLKQLFLSLRPVSASRHASIHPLSFRDLQTCSHVFLRMDSIRKPLEQPYSGPHKILSHTDHRTFIIDCAGTPKKSQWTRSNQPTWKLCNTLI
ncbi:uncharacterized protein LOC106639933 [Copidosoma floridanum]|uniref:uncharacterized protein LOC106639933 n=1 Tax=Copidosoma floridanum TaxID=29053 RepID=UPI0006C95E7C|nr:uncharacterized protein LOC106639933 [Copidosoma floridanum]